MTEKEQRNDFEAKRALAEKDRVIYGLRQEVERHQRANGSLVGDLWKMRDERDAARREAAQLRAEVHDYEDKAAADDAEPSVGDGEVVITERGKFGPNDIGIGDRVVVDWGGEGHRHEGEVVARDDGRDGNAFTLKLRYATVEPVIRESWSDYASIVEVVMKGGAK